MSRLGGLHRYAETLTSTRTSPTDMTDTLKDLEASTINARDMVRLVQGLGLGLNVRIPPPTFLTIISRRKLYIPPPLDVRTFLQLSSLYTPEFGGRSFSAIVAILRAPEDGKTTSEVVLFGDIGLCMTWELMQSVE